MNVARRAAERRVSTRRTGRKRSASKLATAHQKLKNYKSLKRNCYRWFKMFSSIKRQTTSRNSWKNILNPLRPQIIYLYQLTKLETCMKWREPSIWNYSKTTRANATRQHRSVYEEINRTAKSLAGNLNIADRVDTLAKSDAYIKPKNHTVFRCLNCMFSDFFAKPGLSSRAVITFPTQRFLTSLVTLSLLRFCQVTCLLSQTMAYNETTKLKQLSVIQSVMSFST